MVRAREIGKQSNTNIRLATNLELDVLLRDGASRDELRKYSYLWRTGTVYVHPYNNEAFALDERGNICDYFYTLTAASIPKEALGKTGIALVYENPKVEMKDGNVTVSAPPESAIILHNTLQVSGWGEMDKATGIPVLSKNIENVPEDQRRYLWRLKKQRIMPLVRGADFGVARSDIEARGWHLDHVAVAYVKELETNPNTALENSQRP